MCLNPRFIKNPIYLREAHRFPTVCYMGKLYNNVPSNFGYVPFIPPSAYVSVDGTYNPCSTEIVKYLSVSTLDTCYGVSEDGECIPMYLASPCNRCLECLKRKQNDWRTRMLLEQLTSKVEPLFLTLTYNNSCLPANGVSKRDIALFFNHLHTKLGRLGISSIFKHALFSEYGTKYHRPHYHAILFHLDTTDLVYDSYNCYDSNGVRVARPNGVFKRYYGLIALQEIIADVWNKGFIYCVVRDGRAFSYVSKYIGKSMVINVPKGQNDNFISSSRRHGGIGASALNDPNFLSAIRQSNGLVVSFSYNGHIYTCSIPSYIRNKYAPSLLSLIPRNVKHALSDYLAAVTNYRRMGYSVPSYKGVKERFWFLHSYFVFHSQPQRFFETRKLCRSDKTACEYIINNSLSILCAFHFNIHDLLHASLFHDCFIQRVVSSIYDYTLNKTNYSPFEINHRLLHSFIKHYSKSYEEQ